MFLGLSILYLKISEVVISLGKNKTKNCPPPKKKIESACAAYGRWAGRGGRALALQGAGSRSEHWLCSCQVCNLRPVPNLSSR